MNLILFYLTVFVISTFNTNASTRFDWSGDEMPERWLTYGKEKIDKILNQKINKNIAKNIVFFLGDGNIN